MKQCLKCIIVKLAACPLLLFGTAIDLFLCYIHPFLWSYETVSKMHHYKVNCMSVITIWYSYCFVLDVFPFSRLLAATACKVSYVRLVWQKLLYCYTCNLFINWFNRYHLFSNTSCLIWKIHSVLYLKHVRLLKNRLLENKTILEGITK